MNNITLIYGFLHADHFFTGHSFFNLVYYFFYSFFFLSFIKGKMTIVEKVE